MFIIDTHKTDNRLKRVQNVKYTHCMSCNVIFTTVVIGGCKTKCTTGLRFGCTVRGTVNDAKLVSFAWSDSTRTVKVNVRCIGGYAPMLRSHVSRWKSAIEG